MSRPENAVTGASHAYTKNPAFLTKLLKAMLYISLAIGVLSVLSDLLQMQLLTSGSFSDAQAESNDTRQQIISVAYLCAFVITGITFLIWIRRANVNCRGFGAANMEFTPGWSIGNYFIPFLNLYRPYRAMKEIWQVSSNPPDWRNTKSSSLLNWWWALWLLSGFLGQAAFRLTMSAHTLESLQVATSFSILSGLLDVPLYLVTLALVSGIFANQEKWVKQRT